MDLPVITTTEADAYFATTPRAAAWDAVTSDPDILLTEAQTWLASLCWDQQATCCGNDFVASYTRAVSELALALSTDPTALIGSGAAPTTGGVKRQKLGDLEVEYFQAGSGGSASTTPGALRGPLVLRTFPWLRDIIGCWLTNAGTNQLLLRVRS